MGKNKATLLSVTDLTARERHVVCDVPSLGPLLAGWWSELGLSSNAERSHARSLIEAARESDWTKLHALADHLSLDIAPVLVRGNAVIWSPAESWALA